ncbi:MAG: copper resistance protein B [Helicobacteraceae bacterium]|jgi:copper resistance protein B|nr:copper resistance protein B [Helicobacteraceae bacterium]
MKKFLIVVPLCALLGSLLQAEMVDDPLRVTFMMDRLEVQARDNSPLAWDSRGYMGYDLNKLYFYSEGESVNGDTESQNEVVYSRAVSPFWDAQVGVETDTAGSESKSWAVVALQGLSPYSIDTRIRLKVSDKAVAASLDVEYEALLTQRLVLTPRFEINAYSADIPSMGYGAGLSSANLGLRLRYEVRREFAPYIGVQYARSFGNTSDYQYVNEGSFIAGLRFWF